MYTFVGWLQFIVLSTQFRLRRAFSIICRTNL